MVADGFSRGTLAAVDGRGAGEFGSGARLRRSAGIAALVTIVHVGAIYVFLIASRSNGTPAEVDRRSMLIFLREDRPKAEPERRESSRKRREVQPKREPTDPKRKGSESDTKSLTEPDHAIHPATDKAVDWRTAAEDAARDSVARASAGPKYRSLDSRPRTEEPVKIDRPHVRGDTQRLANGELITWIDGSCYATNRDLANPQVGANNVNIVCKGNVGKRKADGTLLQGLRPKYLELPAAPAMRKNTEKAP